MQVPNYCDMQMTSREVIFPVEDCSASQGDGWLPLPDQGVSEEQLMAELC